MPKTLAQKFFIKPDYRLRILDAPGPFLESQLTDLPEGISFVSDPTDNPDITIQFSTNLSHLHSALSQLPPSVIKSNSVWICYPKGGKKAAITTDLNRDIIWKVMVEAGFKAVHQISIDEVWSAVRFKVETGSSPQQIV